MNRARRSVIAVGAAGVLCLFTAWSAVALTAGSASATVSSLAGGIKGDPQPELKPFKFSSTTDSPASSALEPGGSIVAAYDAPLDSTGKLVVCQFRRGARACSRKTSIGTPSRELGVDPTYGPQLQVTSSNHVAVLEDTCCDTNPEGDTLFYSSANGGTTFGPPVRVGSVTVADSVLAGGQVVFIGADSHIGTQVESIPVAPSGPPTSVATLTTAIGPDTPRLGSYHGGVLAAWDAFTKTSTSTSVKYARSGSNFNASGSYHAVLTISKEALLGLWGNALLTIQAGGKETVELRLFNGKSFGSPHAVPGTSGGGPEAFGVYRDPSGEVHVFSDRGLSSPSYELVMDSTSNGTHWSRDNLGNGLTSINFSAALDSRHSGLVIGTAGANEAWGYPLMSAQSVKLNLKPSTIRKGRSATASGKGSPAGRGRLVTMQIDRSGKWYSVATTHENAAGSFSFTIKGKSAGRFTYRAVVSDLAGYLQFGYSPGRSLLVKS
jgi:hypothetical protein